MGMDLVSMILPLVKFICSRIKKKEEAKGKNCHAKTMWSLEKPI
jgi:hypothetical protein